MMRMNRLAIYIVLGIMLISLSSAYEPQQQYTEAIFSVNSNNATYCNVTSLDYPLGHLVLNLPMTKFSQNYNVTINQSYFSQIGDYCFNIECQDPLNNIESGSKCYTVTKTGYSSTLWLLILLLVLGFGLLIFAAAFKNVIFGLFSGMILTATGVFIMINGLDTIVDSWTRMIAGVILGVGVIVMIVAGFEFFKNKKDEVSVGFD